MNPKQLPGLLALVLTLLWNAPRAEAASPDYNVTDMGSGGFMNYLNDHGDGVGALDNPHFPALRSDPMALSGASCKKQITSSPNGPFRGLLQKANY